ncbi:5-methylcytosine-specific restriction endonuclease system specificity protein McrC [Novosphingobium sp. 11B]
MTIPIRNLYFIFCYAWARFPPGDAAKVGADTCPDLLNLFARLLIDGMHRLLRRGLERGYVRKIEDTRSPRGRLLLDEMVKRQTLLRGEAVCQFDDLRTDVLNNQILKATARLLARSPSLLADYRHQLNVLIRSLETISDVRLSGDLFSRTQLTRNNRDYRLLLRLCEFVFRSQLPDQSGESARFADILMDELRMSAVFEEFLRNFYAHEQDAFAVKRDVMAWDAHALTDGGLALMPGMETDITLHAPDRCIVVDAKFYKEPLAGRPGFPKKLRSAHLYQLYTYLAHARLRYPGRQIDGALIYPSTGPKLQADYAIANHRVRIRAVRLDQEWPQIHQDLLDVLSNSFADPNAPQPHMRAEA